MSIAKERDWPHQSHRSLKNAAERIAEEYDDTLIASYFSVAEKFHRHFYHDSMEDWERDADRPKNPRPRSEGIGLRVAAALGPIDYDGTNLLEHPFTTNS